MSQGLGSLCSQSTHRTDTTKALPKLQYREWPTPQPRRKLDNRYTLDLATTPFQTPPRKAKYYKRKGTQKMVLRDHKLAARRGCRRARTQLGNGLQLPTLRPSAHGGGETGKTVILTPRAARGAAQGGASRAGVVPLRKGASSAQPFGSHYLKQCAGVAPGSPPLAASSVWMPAVSSRRLAPLWDSAASGPLIGRSLPRDQARASHPAEV